MRKITLEELNNLLLTKQSFKFTPTNKEIYKLITALCNVHGVYFPGKKNKFRRDCEQPFVSVDSWGKDKEYFIATPICVEDQNQEEIELILPQKSLT